MTMTTHHANRTRQIGIASERSVLHQAAGDLHVHHTAALEGSNPGLGSVAVPTDDVDHVIRGRDALLDELTAVTSEGGRIVVLHGAGGFGKTAIALSLAHRVLRSAHVWWVDATDRTSLANDLREVALRAGAPPRLVRQAWRGTRSAPELLWSALARLDERWLLVLDNADDVEALDHTSGRGWVRTPPPSGTVVITSRDGRAGTWGRRTMTRRVTALDDGDGAAILRELAPHAGTTRQAGELAGALGGLPLVLCLAGRYLNATNNTVRFPGADQPRTFGEYRTLLRDHFTEAVTASTTSREHRRRECLASTWELSLDLLHIRGLPMARPLLRLLSTFAPAPIPCDLLDASALSDSSMFDGITAPTLSRLISDLAGLGLVEVVPGVVDTLALHLLVREANLHQPDVVAHQQEYGEARVSLLHRLATHAAHDDPSTWPLWRALLPHCVHERSEGHSTLALAAVRHNTATYSHEQGLLATAEHLYRQALHARVDAGGSRHPDSLATGHNLAVLLADRGDTAAARDRFREVLAGQQDVLGAWHPDTLNTRRGLARTLWDSGEPDVAEAQYRDIVAAQCQVLGADHPDTLITRYEAAGLLDEHGNAAAYLRGVLDDQIRVLGGDHPHTLITRQRLAQPDSCAPEFHEVITRTSAVLGPEHPTTLCARHTLAVVSHATSDWAAAVAELRDILEIQLRTLGPRHPDTVASQHNLGVIGCPEWTPVTALGRGRDRIGVADALPGLAG